MITKTCKTCGKIFKTYPSHDRMHCSNECYKRPKGEQNGKWICGYSEINNYVRCTHGANRGKPLHVIIAESVLGKELPKGACVHHVDGNTLNNSKTNLVICHNHSYHKLLHHRKNAFENCGNPNKRKCNFCKQYDFIENMYVTKNGNIYHMSCSVENNRQKRKQIKEGA